MRKRLVRFIPQPLRPALRTLYYLPLTLAHWIKFTKHGKGMVPPASMVFVGRGDFEKIGAEFRRYFVELGGLQPGHRVLDIGCGIGRMAIPLTEYLSADGEYWGIDIVKQGIEWCESRVTPRFPNFHFRHSDVFNRHYNPQGTVPAAAYRLPFDDGSLDFAFLTSVFTHMHAPDVENYLRETARVLKAGGKCLATFFLLNEEAKKLVSEGRSDLDFRYPIAHGCLTVSEQDPETAIACEQSLVEGLYARYGLRIAQPVRYGAWCGRKEFLSYQDIVIAEKAG